MSKNWYPVIDYDECSECSACVDFCPHGVYDKSKSPAPVVVYPESCIEVIKIVLGSLIMLLAFYMFYLGF